MGEWRQNNIALLQDNGSNAKSGRMQKLTFEELPDDVLRTRRRHELAVRDVLFN